MFPVLRRRTVDIDNPMDLLRRDFGFFGNDLSRALTTWWPNELADDGFVASYPVDVSEKDNKILVEAELPGFDKKEIDISLDNGILTISAERLGQKEEKGQTQHLHERRWTKVQRRLSLPSEVDDKKASVKFENGVLRLELPKAGGSKNRKIAVS